MAHNPSPIARALAAIALATAATACGSSAPAHPAGGHPHAAPAGRHRASAARAAAVSISGYAFHPAAIVVAPGATITFTNHDQTAHTATATRPGLDTSTINPGRSATLTLRTPGMYTYYCQFHAFMRGTIVVR